MIISEMIVLKLLAGASEAGTVIVIPVTGGPGWKFVMDFDMFRTKRDAEEEERKRIKELVEDIESPVDREIATLLQEDLDKEARKQQIKELQRIIAENATAQDLMAAEAHNVAKAFARAAMQKNFSAIEALEREMDKKIEEDEFLMLAILLNA